MYTQLQYNGFYPTGTVIYVYIVEPSTIICLETKAISCSTGMYSVESTYVSDLFSDQEFFDYNVITGIGIVFYTMSNTHHSAY